MAGRDSRVRRFGQLCQLLIMCTAATKFRL
jgi:hypothetical protein